MTEMIVLGGGAIGASVAWRCAQRGLTVTVLDPDLSRGAWNTAAGMLAPISELHYTETPLLELGREAARRHREFCAELSAETGRPTGYDATGTLVVAWDSADLRALHDLTAFATGLGVEASVLTGRELRSLEPAFAPGLPGGMLAPDDHQVDPRLLHRALVAACSARGVRFVTASGTPQPDGARLEDGTLLRADVVVDARGAWAGAPVRPVKGQTLRLRLPAPPLRHVIRATVKGTPSYLVPRADGEVIVGASSEDAGFDLNPRAGAVYELLRDAQSLVPELGEATLAEVCTGLRPGSPDNAPLVGWSDGVLRATGHYRSGILLAPITADAIAALAVGDAPPAVLAPFGPGRLEVHS